MCRSCRRRGRFSMRSAIFSRRRTTRPEREGARLQENEAHGRTTKACKFGRLFLVCRRVFTRGDISVMAFFRAYKADKLKVPTYFIESTAPDNVDDTQTAGDPRQEIPENLRAYLEYVDDADQVVKDIADRLAQGKNPNLVVMVHGFN